VGPTSSDRCLLRDRREDIKRPCEDRGRDWNSVAIGQGSLESSEAPRSKEGLILP